MIEIFLNTFAKQEGPYQDRLSLEELEDALRNLLLEKGFKDFSIEDDYTGNSIREMPQLEQEELDATERPVSQAKVEAEQCKQN